MNLFVYVFFILFQALSLPEQESAISCVIMYTKEFATANMDYDRLKQDAMAEDT